MMRVLIADDDYSIRCCMQQQINWRGIQCEKPEIVANGAEALDRIARVQPDIIISDIKMPVMDGKELCSIVREKYPEVVFIFLSAYEDFAASRLAIQCNVKGYLLKPLDRDALNELESMVYDIVCQKANKEMLFKIASDQYKDYFIKIIEDQNVDELEALFDKIDELYEEPETNRINVWTHMITPVYIYRFLHGNKNNSQLFQDEKWAKEEILKLPKDERIPFLRNLYLAEMLGTDKNCASHDVIDMICKLLQKNYSDPEFNISALAQMVQLSPSYVGKIFTEKTGKRLIDYLSELRLKRACQLLRETTNTVKGVAEMSGYSDANYFARLFRQKMGMPPIEYRNKNQ